MAMCRHLGGSGRAVRPEATARMGDDPLQRERDTKPARANIGERSGSRERGPAIQEERGRPELLGPGSRRPRVRRESVGPGHVVPESGGRVELEEDSEISPLFTPLHNLVTRSNNES